jgi:hypothetical protein
MLSELTLIQSLNEYNTLDDKLKRVLTFYEFDSLQIQNDKNLKWKPTYKKKYKVGAGRYAHTYWTDYKE